MHWNPLDFFRRKKEEPGKDIEHVLAASPVPYILMMVLIWASASVLLLCSEGQVRNLDIWNEGQYAPFAVWARNTFFCADNAKTGPLREKAREKSPYFLRIDQELSAGIRKSAAEFFAGKEGGKYLQFPKRKEKFDVLLADLLAHGIAASQKNLPAARELRVLAPDRIYHGMPADVNECAGKLAAVFELNGDESRALAEKLAEIMGKGNLVFDRTATETEANIAAAKVKTVFKKYERGDLLIERRQLITREHAEIFNAEKLSLPAGYGLALLGSRLLLSFILLLTAQFFLYRTYPEIFRTPRRFCIAGFSLILSLLINFAALRIFFSFFSRGVLGDYELMLFIMPMPFGAALISILLGNRTAVFSGFLTASVTALMTMHAETFGLVIRWFAVAALMTLFIRNVSNYRSFFVRVFFCGALLTAVVNCDVIYSFRHDPGLLKQLMLVISGNALFCGIASLLAVFVFELVFNVDTPMSLMVLGDFNHPLLEQLKRNAPGTMFHSMTTATLAEDAAKAIRANSARAKVGALFHDIGKLYKPEDFVENNVDSPGEYAKISPTECCFRIRRHVSEGLVLAREYRLNSFIRKAIVTHHGDDLISFFYQRALEQNEGNPQKLNEADFHYHGEPPAGKELSIISLADACEAASRSLNKPTAEMIEKLVNDIFAHRMRNGQLRNSQLTLEELELVRKSFISNLISLNHSRIAYKKEAKS